MKTVNLCVIAVCALTGLGVAGIVAMEWLRPDGYNTQVVNWIISMIVPTVTGLMVLIRSAMNATEAKEIKEDVKEVKMEARAAATKAAEAAEVASKIVEPPK
jgi:hypothetical protein